tara:strand:+ start:8047 stop:8784 length:738 start_codon:yes stop_codon:yes gene_type:complete
MFPFPQMFAARAAPVVEPVSQLQQLIRPLEQSLLRLEQRPAQLSQQQIEEGKQEADPRLGLRDVADYVSRFYESFQQQPGFEPSPVSSNFHGGRAALPSSSSSSDYDRAFQEIQEMSTQTDLSFPMDRQVGIQYQIEAVRPPLVEAVRPPLIDAIVAPHEEDIIIEELEEEPRGQALTEEDLRRIRDRNGLTETFLQTFPIRGTQKKRGHNLISIARAVGVPLPKTISRDGRKVDFIDYIIKNLP